MEITRQMAAQHCEYGERALYADKLEAEVTQLRETIRYWSYCTRMGVLQTCPEKIEEFKESMKDAGVPVP